MHGLSGLSTFFVRHAASVRNCERSVFVIGQVIFCPKSASASATGASPCSPEQAVALLWVSDSNWICLSSWVIGQTVKM